MPFPRHSNFFNFIDFFPGQLAKKVPVACLELLREILELNSNYDLVVNRDDFKVEGDSIKLIKKLN